MSVAAANRTLAGRRRSRTRRMALTSGPSAEPQAAVATKQPDSCVNCTAGVLKVVWAMGEGCPHPSNDRTPTTYSVFGIKGEIVKEAGEPGLPGGTCCSMIACEKSASVIEVPGRYRIS